MIRYNWKRIQHGVFWPPFILLISAVTASALTPEFFQKLVTGANDWILNSFDWAFSYTSFIMVLLCLAVTLSPIGSWKIGGDNATPMLSKWKWFSIVLCTSVAVGILFWGTAEPLFHFGSPPKSLASASQAELVSFSMSTMFMHWSFTPYAIYCVPAILFALAYYNNERAFSLGSMLFPVIRYPNALITKIINVLCLFALVAGMSASLGAGLLSIAGGLDRYLHTGVDALALGIVALITVGTFTVSAASGLLKGIQWLSSFNMLIFIVLVAFVFIAGPTMDILEFAWDGISTYALNFIPHSLSIGSFNDTDWTHSWTTFYWANWMAWAPITALFMGRLAYGYTVRQFMVFNWVLPSLFSIFWMSVFSGTVLSQEIGGGGLVELLHSSGPQTIVYEMIAEFPIATVIAGLFILTMFVSYVTAADSNTMAMSGLSSKGVTADNPEPPVFIKYTWGVVVGLVAWVMVSFAGVDGVKMLSNLGGLPALFLLFACCIALLALLWRNRKG